MRDRVDLEAQQIGHRATSMLVSAFLTRFEPMDVARRIALTLAADTTATECGACPHIRRTLGMSRCEVFRRALESGEVETPPIPFPSRLPECIQAEVK